MPSELKENVCHVASPAPSNTPAPTAPSAPTPKTPLSAPSVLSSEETQHQQKQQQQLPQNRSKAPWLVDFEFALLNHPLFSGSATPSLCSDLITTATLRTCALGDSLIRSGEVGCSMFFLVRGCVTITSPDGETVFATLNPGAFFGEVALLHDCVRIASAQCASRCIVLVLQKRDLMSLFSRHPTFSDALKRAARERIDFAVKAQSNVPYTNANTAKLLKTPVVLKSSISSAPASPSKTSICSISENESHSLLGVENHTDLRLASIQSLVSPSLAYNTTTNSPLLSPESEKSPMERKRSASISLVSTSFLSIPASSAGGAGFRAKGKPNYSRLSISISLPKNDQSQKTMALSATATTTTTTTTTPTATFAIDTGTANRSSAKAAPSGAYTAPALSSTTATNPNVSTLEASLAKITREPDNILTMPLTATTAVIEPITPPLTEYEKKANVPSTETAIKSPIDAIDDDSSDSTHSSASISTSSPTPAPPSASAITVPNSLGTSFQPIFSTTLSSFSPRRDSTAPWTDLRLALLAAQKPESHQSLSTATPLKSSQLNSNSPSSSLLSVSRSPCASLFDLSPHEDSLNSFNKLFPLDIQDDEYSFMVPNEIDDNIQKVKESVPTVQEFEEILANKSKPKSAGSLLVANYLDTMTCLKLRVVSRHLYYWFARNQKIWTQNFDFSGYRAITNSSLHVLAREWAPNIRTLSLRNCYEITDDGLQPIFMSCLNLQKLDISKCFKLKLYFAIKPDEQLTDLKWFDCSEITDLKTLPFCGALARMPNLKHLRFDNCKCLHWSIFCTREDIYAIGESIFVENAPPEFYQPRWPELEHLSLHRIIQGKQHAWARLRDTTAFWQLKHLVLSECSWVTNEIIDIIAILCPVLEEFSISFCNAVTCSASPLFAKFKQLKILDVSYCNLLVTDATAIDLCTKIPKLQKISLRGCGQITDAFVDNLLAAKDESLVPTSINTVNVSQCTKLSPGAISKASQFWELSKERKILSSWP